MVGSKKNLFTVLLRNTRPDKIVMVNYFFFINIESFHLQSSHLGEFRFIPGKTLAKI